MTMLKIENMVKDDMPYFPSTTVVDSTQVAFIHTENKVRVLVAGNPVGHIILNDGTPNGFIKWLQECAFEGQGVYYVPSKS